MNNRAEIKKTTQSRYAQYSSQSANLTSTRNSRIAHSPLRNPLQSALNKVVTNFISDKRRTTAVSPGRFGSTPRSKIFSSSSRNINNFSIDSYEEDREVLQKMHPQAMEFLKKYFSGYAASMVPVQTFVQYLTKEYSTLWTESQAQAVFPEFAQKVMSKLGQQNVSLARLYGLTKDNGLIGLILNIFRELKQQQDYIEQNSANHSLNYILDSKQSLNSTVNPANSPQLQNVKNIIQQFTESLYQSTQNQIYAKLNGQMRRLVLKYKQAEAILKIINDRINEDIDKIHYERKKVQLEKSHEQELGRLRDRISKLEGELRVERTANDTLRSENQKYKQDNMKICETMEKFQNCLLKKNEEHASKGEGNKAVGVLVVHPISVAYQNPILPFGSESQRKNAISTTVTTFDKQNKLSLNSLNGVVRPTTPLKTITRPSVSPSRFLKITRH